MMAASVVGFLSRCLRPLALSRIPRSIQSSHSKIAVWAHSSRLHASCCLAGSWRSYSSNSVTEPSGNYKYTDSHEWASLEGNIATIGISNYAQDKLGEAVFVDVPEVGDAVTGGEQFGAVESVKAAADLISPMSGSVSDVNTALQDEPALLNKDPYGEGWIMKVEVSDKSEYDKLMSPEEYAQFLSDSA